MLIMFIVPATAAAGGLFGSPQPVSREAGGLHTAIGYWYNEDIYKNGTHHLIRQNQIYSEAGYGFGKYADVYARAGISDLKIFDAFHSSGASTSTNKNDFEDKWNYFGTLGAKGFYPISDIIGVGAFIQGTYYFGEFYDNVAGIESGTPFITELRLKNLWDISAGIGLQIAFPFGIKFYIGPYGYYSEAKVFSLANIEGLPFAADEVKMKSKTNWGGYTGFIVPLGKGFGLSVEGQYSERFSAGAAVTYAY